MLEWKKLCFIVLMLAIVAYAEGNSNEAKSNVLDMKYAQVSCRVAFYTGILNDVKAVSNVSGIDDLVNKLETDLASLKTASQTSRSGTQDAMKKVADDSKEVLAKYKEASESLKGNDKKEARKEIRKKFVEKKQEMGKCLQDASVGLAKTRLGYMEEVQGREEKSADELESRGINTSKMRDLLDKRKKNIDGLRGEIESGDAEKVRQTQREIYEEHLHLWARFQIERLRAVLNAMQDKAKEMGYQTDLDNINSILVDAESYVKVGSKYSDGSFEKVKEDLKKSAEAMRILYKKIKGESK